MARLKRLGLQLSEVDYYYAMSMDDSAWAKQGKENLVHLVGLNVLRGNERIAKEGKKKD